MQKTYIRIARLNGAWSGCTVRGIYVYFLGGRCAEFVLSVTQRSWVLDLVVRDYLNFMSR